jgi:hypothetical protein
MTDLQVAFIRLDMYIQQVDDNELAQKLIYGMIDIMNALAKKELEGYFNGCEEEEIN